MKNDAEAIGLLIEMIKMESKKHPQLLARIKEIYVNNYKNWNGKVKEIVEKMIEKKHNEIDYDE